jgi:hypothetical protein
MGPLGPADGVCDWYCPSLRCMSLTDARGWSAAAAGRESLRGPFSDFDEAVDSPRMRYGSAAGLEGDSCEGYSGEEGWIGLPAILVKSCGRF